MKGSNGNGESTSEEKNLAEIAAKAAQRPAATAHAYPLPSLSSLRISLSLSFLYCCRSPNDDDDDCPQGTILRSLLVPGKLAFGPGFKIDNPD